jgi:hypothetical protein
MRFPGARFVASNFGEATSDSRPRVRAMASGGTRVGPANQHPADRQYATARQRRGHDQATDERRLDNWQSSSPSDAAVSQEP